MPEKGLKPSGFDSVLAHLSAHGVVVCKACHFAVQPKALPSHLLRHQIYRDERRQLLQRCSKLDLLEPEDVVNPPPNSHPLPHLSVQRGFRCDASGCDHACVSSKRMSQHWSELHNEPDSRNVQARPVFLQTFFRGNKIKYFEVNGPGYEQLEANEPERRRPTPRPEPNETNSSTSSNLLTVPSEISSMSWNSPSHDTISSLDEEQAPVHLDLENLQYFHHYMYNTGVTLRRGESESACFWRVDIVNEAFRYPFLMYGILGVAASHLTMLHAEGGPAAVRERHRRAALRYQQAALGDFRSAIREPDVHNSTALIAFGRVIGVQTSVQHQLNYRFPHLGSPAAVPSSSSVASSASASAAAAAPDLTDHNPTSLARVLEVFFLLRGVGEMLLSFQPLLPHGSDFLLSEEVLEGLRDQSPEPEEMDSTIDGSSSSSVATVTVPKYGNMTLEELARLPVPAIQGLIGLRERLAPLLDPMDPGTPELEVAIEALLSAYGRAFAGTAATAVSEGTTTTNAAADASWVKWNGAEGWLRRASEHYVKMLSAGEPAALVVFAHWCPLLERLEKDYWFIRGQAGCLVEIVRAHLPGEEWRDLVRGLLVEGGTW